MKHYFEADNMDELFYQIIKELMDNGETVYPRGVEVKEIRHCSFGLTNPRKRIIFNPIRKFSLPYAVGELCWYLTGSNKLDFISHYGSAWKNMSDNGETLNSAYGYRIFKGEHPLIPFNQWENVIRQLREDPDTRQAVIHLHTPNDKKTKDEVCTLCLQFFIRNGKLEMETTMRSNDIVWGTAYDVFAFTFLQEMMAEELGVELGMYYHYAGSMHLYKKNYKTASNVIDNISSKYFSANEMPQFKNHKYNTPLLLSIEEIYRKSNLLNHSETSKIQHVLDRSWTLLANILEMHYIDNIEKDPYGAFLISKYVLNDIKDVYPEAYHMLIEKYKSKGVIV